MVFQMTAIHSINAFQMTIRRLHRLPLFKNLVLLVSEAFEFTPVQEIAFQDLRLHTRITQICVDDPRRHTSRLNQSAGLLQLLSQRVAVIRITREAANTYDEVAIQRCGAAGLYPKLIRRPGFAIRIALHFLIAPGIDLVSLLAHGAPTASRFNLCTRISNIPRASWLLCGKHCLATLDPACLVPGNRVLTFDPLVHASVLFGMRLAGPFLDCFRPSLA